MSIGVAIFIRCDGQQRAVVLKAHKGLKRAQDARMRRGMPRPLKEMPRQMVSASEVEGTARAPVQQLRASVQRHGR